MTGTKQWRSEAKEKEVEGADNGGANTGEGRENGRLGCRGGVSD